jgi:hypothetical protein
MADPVLNGAAEEELVDYEEEEVVEGEAAKGDQVRLIEPSWHGHSGGRRLGRRGVC